MEQYLLIYYINFKRASLKTLLTKSNLLYKIYFLVSKLLKQKRRKIARIINFLALYSLMPGLLLYFYTLA